MKRKMSHNWKFAAPSKRSVDRPWMTPICLPLAQQDCECKTYCKCGCECYCQEDSDSQDELEPFCVVPTLDLDPGCRLSCLDISVPVDQPSLDTLSMIVTLVSLTVSIFPDVDATRLENLVDLQTLVFKAPFGNRGLPRLDVFLRLQKLTIKGRGSSLNDTLDLSLRSWDLTFLSVDWPFWEFSQDADVSVKLVSLETLCLRVEPDANLRILTSLKSLTSLSLKSDDLAFPLATLAGLDVPSLSLSSPKLVTESLQFVGAMHKLEILKLEADHLTTVSLCPVRNPALAILHLKQVTVVHLECLLQLPCLAMISLVDVVMFKQDRLAYTKRFPHFPDPKTKMNKSKFMFRNSSTGNSI